MLTATLIQFVYDEGRSSEDQNTLIAVFTAYH
jgi:hypothetical protein